LKTSGISFSGRFPLAMAVIFGLLILVTAILFYRITGEVTSAYRSRVMERHHELIIEQSRLVMERLRIKGVTPSPSALSKAVKRMTAERPDFLYLMILKKSSDDNFFTLKKKLPLSENLKIDLSEGTAIQDRQSIDYLKKGQLYGVADPTLYSKNKFTWQVVYQPYRVGKKNLVLQFFISAATARSSIESLNGAISSNRKILVFSSTILVIIFAVLLFLFTRNYSSLVSNLSRYMQMAADGNLDININRVADGELDELARSFNTLIEEMRDLKGKDMEQEVIPPEDQNNVIIDDLFSQGVTFLKQNNLTASVTCFEFIINHRKNSFGSYFNLGVTRAKQKNYPDSLAMFLKAQDINPDHEMTGQYIERVNRLIENNAS